MAKNYSSSNLSNSSFAGLSLEDADFSCSNLFNSDFSNANLKRANFSNCNLANANFAGANIEGAVFAGANLSTARFSKQGESPTPKPQPGPAEVVASKEYEKVAVSEVYYENNVQGIGKLDDSQKWYQTIRKRDVGGKTQYGWQWEWPNQRMEGGGVWAYPEIVFGWKPWSVNVADAPAAKSNTTRLPKRIKDIKNCTLTFGIELSNIQGEYNFTPELYLTDVDTSIVSTNIKTEIMIWLDYSSTTTISPAGDLYSASPEVTIGGKVFQVFVKEEIEIPSPPAKWRIVTYRLKEKPMYEGVLLMHEFIKHAIANNLASADHFLASIEFGNEVFTGKGEAWVNRFELEIA